MMDYIVQISRRFDTTVDNIFRAWTEPDLLEKWWCTPGYRFSDIQIDLQSGGKYRYELVPNEGQKGPTCLMEGVFEEVIANEKLVYSWTISAGDFREADTQVFVSLNADGDSTDVTLTHQGFNTQEGYELHALDWAIVLSNLAEVLSPASAQSQV